MLKDGVQQDPQLSSLLFLSKSLPVVCVQAVAVVGVQALSLVVVAGLQALVVVDAQVQLGLF